MAKAVYLIDTSIIIEALRGNKKLRRFLERQKFYYSIITRKELFKKKNLMRSEIMEIEKYLLLGTPLFIDTQTLEGVRILAPFYRKKNISDIHDIIIAAVALVKRLPLAALNRKHFSFIKGLKLITLD